jgi:hypothetical protein
MPDAARFTKVCPVLPARNVGDAIRFYVERLGFALVFQDGLTFMRDL